jgi:hypothetical protein
MRVKIQEFWNRWLIYLPYWQKKKIEPVNDVLYHFPSFRKEGSRNWPFPWRGNTFWYRCWPRHSVVIFIFVETLMHFFLIGNTDNSRSQPKDRDEKLPFLNLKWNYNRNLNGFITCLRIPFSNSPVDVHGKCFSYEKSADTLKLLKMVNWVFSAS